MRTGQGRSGQIGAGQFRAGQFVAGQVRSGQGRAGQVRSGQVRTTASTHRTQRLWPFRCAGLWLRSTDVKDYTFWRQFNERPTSIPGCPVDLQISRLRRMGSAAESHTLPTPKN